MTIYLILVLTQIIDKKLGEILNKTFLAYNVYNSLYWLFHWYSVMKEWEWLW